MKCPFCDGTGIVETKIEAEAKKLMRVLDAMKRAGLPDNIEEAMEHIRFLMAVVKGAQIELLKAKNKASANV